jgi:hypothetical protein
MKMNRCIIVHLNRNLVTISYLKIDRHSNWFLILSVPWFSRIHFYVCVILI